MENLDKFANKLLEYLQSAELFITTQLPDFVQQFIAYEIWAAEWWFYVALAFFVSLIITQAIVLCMIFRNDHSENLLAAFMFVGCVGIMSSIMVVDKYSKLKRLEIAPKVYMIEQARDMIKGKD